MIKSLSHIQVSQLAIYQEKWINIVLSTKPIPIPFVEAAVREYYESICLAAPKSIVHTYSPVNTVATIREITSIEIWSEIWKTLQNSQHTISNKVTSQVWNQVWNHVGKQIAQVSDQAVDRVWNLVWNQVEHENKEYISLSNVLRLNLYFSDKFFYSMSAIYDYFREVCGLMKETEKVAALLNMGKCCGRLSLHKDIAIIQHRPCFLNFDDEKRLHCENGMAIRYRDGFGVWAIHGVRVDEQIVMKPAEQTVSQIREEGNAEVKRIRIERFGWNRYITKIGAKVIDSRHNDIENTEETLVKTPDGMTILLPTCKTGRLFSLEVPSIIFTCEQAQNWLHGGSRLDGIVGKTRVIGRS